MIKLTRFFNFIKTARFQVSLLVIALAYIIALLIYEQKREFFKEDIYPILKVTEEVKQLSSNVDVGLNINDFPKFSFMTNDFTLDAFVWFKFPIGTVSLDTIDNFDFKNGEIREKTKPIIKTIKNDVVISYHVKVDFKTYLNYKYFPLGDHRINIILDNKSVTPNELCFNCDLSDFVMSEKTLIENWKATSKMVQTGYLKSTLKQSNPAITISYPCAVFTIDFENTSSRDILTLYFPMFVIFFICLFSLVIDLDQYLSRMSLTSAAVPLLALFRMTMLQQSPVAGDLTKSDFVYFLLVSLSLIILIFQVYLIIVMKRIKRYTEERKKKYKRHLEKANNLIFIVVIILLVVFITYNSNLK